MLERWARLLEEHIHSNCEQMTREPAGQLAHPYTVPSRPGSAYYSDALVGLGLLVDQYRARAGRS